MNLEFLFFELFPALKFIFKIGYIPQNIDFKELTSEQYLSFFSQASEEDLELSHGKKLLAFLPDDAKVYNRLVTIYGNQLVIIKEEEFYAFLKATEYINKCCDDSGRKFANITDKLIYMSQILPEIFTEGTSYAIHCKCRNLRQSCD